jgi:hypothetical protein
MSIMMFLGNRAISATPSALIATTAASSVVSTITTVALATYTGIIFYGPTAISSFLAAKFSTVVAFTWLGFPSTCVTVPMMAATSPGT